MRPPDVSSGGSVSTMERTGVVVIRVWIESAAEAGGGFRARVTLVRDVEHNASETLVAATPEEIVEIVHGFLEEFAAAR